MQVEGPSLHLEPLMGTPVKQPPSKSARVVSPSSTLPPGFGGAGGSEAAVVGNSAGGAGSFAGISSARASELAARDMDLDDEDDAGLADGSRDGGAKTGEGLGEDGLSAAETGDNTSVPQTRFASTARKF